MKYAIPLLLAIIGILNVNVAQAAIFNAVDRGWYDHTGAHSSGNKNTITGQDGSGTTDYNSFFLFNLGSLSGTVTSGVLRLELEAYFGPDAFEAFTVYDVSTPAGLLSANNSGQVGIFNDLQSGNIYGTGSATASQVGTILTINLSAAAIANINAAAGGTFAVGVHLNQITLPSGDEALRFSGGSESRVHQLDLQTSAVPEPATLSMFGLGALGLGFATYRRRKITT
jgi:hypothetical protein